MSDRILVTGFGPFGSHSVNASWEAVRLLPDEIDGINIIKEEIPVKYTHVETEVPLLWKAYNPLLVIHVGVSSEARKITLEHCANRDGYMKCDFFGKTHVTGCACETGEEYIATAINVSDICNRINDCGKIEACVSINAGRYLCEFIYYTSLNIDSSRSLFVHVPPLSEPYSAAELSEGLLEIIHCCLEQLHTSKEKILKTNTK